MVPGAGSRGGAEAGPGDLAASVLVQRPRGEVAVVLGGEQQHLHRGAGAQVRLEEGEGEQERGGGDSGLRLVFFFRYVDTLIVRWRWRLKILTPENHKRNCGGCEPSL